MTGGDAGDAAARTVETQAAYARRLGKPRQWVHKRITKGHLTPPAVLPNGRIWVEEADRQLAAVSESADLPDQPLAADLPVLAVERARKEAAQATLKELELARVRGELLDRRGAEAAAEDFARQVRDRVLAVPREVAADCARLADEIAIEARITLALKAALDGLHAELSATDAVRGPA